MLSMQSETRKFNKVIEIARAKSLELGIRSIDVDEAHLIYTILYLYTILHRTCIRVIEISSGCGYFTLWIAKAIVDSGADECSSVVSIESDDVKASITKELVKTSGFSYFVRILKGNIKEILKLIPGPIDVLFINNPGFKYLEYLEIVHYKLRNRGLVIAHNVLDIEPSLVMDFMREISNAHKWFTTIIRTKHGLAISIKRS